MAGLSYKVVSFEFWVFLYQFEGFMNQSILLGFGASWLKTVELPFYLETVVEAFCYQIWPESELWQAHPHGILTQWNWTLISAQHFPLEEVTGDLSPDIAQSAIPFLPI